MHVVKRNPGEWHLLSMVCKERPLTVLDDPFLSMFGMEAASCVHFSPQNQPLAREPCFVMTAFFVGFSMIDCLDD